MTTAKNTRDGGGAQPQFSMQPEDAKKLMGKLLTIPSGDLPAGTPEAELLEWMRENQPPNTGLLSVYNTMNPPSKP